MTDGRKPYSNLEIFDVVTYLLSSPNAHVQIDEDLETNWYYHAKYVFTFKAKMENYKCTKRIKKIYRHDKCQ